jgi:anaerobic selenocysteine-containing dehydrogenase
MPWQRDQPDSFVKGYLPLWMNTVDASSRGISDGDVIRVFNDRGHILCAARVVETVVPGVVYTWEGGWYSPKEPGVIGSLDMGGCANVLIPPEQPEPLADGFTTQTLVEVEKWEE